MGSRTPTFKKGLAICTAAVHIYRRRTLAYLQSIPGFLAAQVYGYTISLIKNNEQIEVCAEQRRTLTSGLVLLWPPLASLSRHVGMQHTLHGFRGPNDAELTLPGKHKHCA